MTESSTSFEGIIENLRKRRGEFHGECSELQLKDSQQETVRPLNIQSSSSGPVVNSFNQSHTEAAEKSFSRYEGTHVQGNGKRDGDSSKTILVSTSQTGNPLLKHFTNIAWRYVKSSATNKILYDYKVGERNIIFLSLKYHKLHPEYIRKKMLPFARSEGNVLLCVSDIENSEDILKELNKLCIFGGFTMLLAFSFEQAGKYLTFMNK